LKLTVTGEIFDLFPEVAIGVLVARGIDNVSDAGDARDLEERLRAAQESLRARLAGGVLAEHPRIHCWREAYRAFGAKPKDNPSSIESLARRTAKGEALRHINRLVDLYNVVSLSHFVPAGGEDLDKLEGDVFLTRASDSEAGVALLGEREARPPKPGEVIYKDSRSAICRRWNWKEAERTKLTEETKNAVLVIEAIPPISREELLAACRDLANRVRESCGGVVNEAVLDASVREMTLVR
jgi:DNA/RNA-binding domain of Phe-tRNA-synthetase-like protein